MWRAHSCARTLSLFPLCHPERSEGPLHFACAPANPLSSTPTSLQTPANKSMFLTFLPISTRPETRWKTKSRRRSKFTRKLVLEWCGSGDGSSRSDSSTSHSGEASWRLCCGHTTSECTSGTKPLMSSGACDRRVENRVSQGASLPHSIAQNAIECSPSIVWATRHAHTQQSASHGVTGSPEYVCTLPSLSGTAQTQTLPVTSCARCNLTRLSMRESHS